MKRLFYPVALCLMLAAAGVKAAEQEAIVFSTAPTHSREETLRLYTPLINYLSEVTGRAFVIEPASNFIQYSVRMRLERYDMLFDGPHLSAWRIDNLGHQPLARLPGTIRIVVVAREDSNVEGMSETQLGESRICAFASPNMLTMAFLSYFPNPARQPMMLRVQGFEELVRCLRSGRGDVAVMSEKQWETMDQSGLKLIATPERAYPERTFTLSGKLGPELRQQLREALLSEEGVKASEALLQRFNKKGLIAVDSGDYAGLSKLLIPVWGFHSRD